MNNNNGAISFDAIINDSDFQRKFDDMERRIKGFTDNTGKETQKVDDQFKKLSTSIAAYFTFDALKNLANEIITVRGEFQQMETAFKVMLGSKEKANALMAQIAELASTTPYGLKDIGTGAKMLIAYGTSADNAVKTLTMLGDVASGVSAPLNDIVYLYGTLQSSGRAYSQDIQQFAGRGIPIYKELANVLGINQSEVKKFVEAGKVGFKEVEQAFKNMTSTGGMFSGSMMEQSKTITGLISTLKDNIDQMFNDIGKNQEGFISDTIKFATLATQNYKTIADVLMVLVATYGAYKTAVILTTTVEAVATATTSGWTVATLLQYRALLMAESAQKALNLTMLANPYVLATTLLVGLGASIYLLSKNSNAASMAQETLSNATKKASESMAGEISKIEILKAQINSESLSRQARNEKLKEFIAIAPDQLKAITLENFNTIESKKAIDDYITSKTRQIEMKQIEADLEDSIKRKQKLKAGEGSAMSYGLSIIDNALGTRLYEDNLKKQIAIEEEYQKTIKKRVIEVAKANDPKATPTAKPPQVVKNQEWYKNEIKNLETLQSKYAVGSKQYIEYANKIEKLQSILNPKSATKPKKEEEPAPFGSLNYWDNVIQKAQIAMESTANPAIITKNNAIKQDAERKAEEIRKGFVIKTFEQELEEKKKQYDLYEKWVQFVSKESADAQFSTLRKNGKTYADYLANQIEMLKIQSEQGVISEKGKKTLVSLSVEYETVTSTKSGIDIFKEGLIKAQQESKNLADYLVKLKELQDSLRGDTTTAGIQKNVEVAIELNQTQAKIQENLKTFVENSQNYEQQILNINKKYDDLKSAADSQYSDKKNMEYLKTIELIRQGRATELKEVEDSNIKNLDSYKALQSTLIESNRDGLKKRLELETKYLNDLKLKYGEQSKEYLAQLKIVSETQGKLQQDTLKTALEFASLAGELGGVLSQLSGGFGDFGRTLQGVASSAKSISVGFDKTATDSQKAQAGIDGVLQLTNMLISASAERERAENEYRRNALQFEQDYKLAINERLGLVSASEENVFVKNFQGRLRDSFAMFNDASKEYKDALDKLNEGLAKVGQEDATSWANIGKGAGAGAAIGATVGSIVPVIGTAIGAAVGALVGGLAGLFGGKVKEDTYASLLKLYPNLVKTAANGQKILNKELAQTLITDNQVDDATKQMLQSAIDWTTQLEKARDAVKGIISELAGNLGNKLRDNLVNAFKEGTSAAQAFGDSVGSVLEDILSQLIFNQVFSKAFDDLQAQLIASSDVVNGGDNNWIDDFGAFFAQADGLWNEFYKGLTSAQDAASKYGISVFGKSNDNATAMAGAIKGMSEETAGLLAGQFNALRINSAVQVQLTRDANGYLSRMAQDISLYLPYLRSIDVRLERLNSGDSLRSKGL
jgi:tape measure domain-containing protein